MSTEPHPTAASNGSKTALTHVRVFDGGRLREPATIVIDGDVIGSDPADAPGDRRRWWRAAAGVD
ncbi:MAG: hypothetical protein WAK93_06095 [Solirubrobacteraceae bacterium]